MALRSPQEIEKQLAKAQSWSSVDETNYESMSFEEGVEEALRWALGEQDEEPIGEEYFDNEEDATA